MVEKNCCCQNLEYICGAARVSIPQTFAIGSSAVCTVQRPVLAVCLTQCDFICGTNKANLCQIVLITIIFNDR